MIINNSMGEIMEILINVELWILFVFFGLDWSDMW